MATNANVDILLRVREEGLAKMRQVAAETGGLVGTMQRLTAGLGLFGGWSVAIATVGGATFATARRMADLSEQVTRASKITGASSETLQGMFKIVSDGGGDTEALTKALAKFRAEVGQNNPLIAKLGLTTGSVEERFIKFMGILSRSPNEFAKAAAAEALMGKTGEQMLAHVSELATGTGAAIEALKASHQMITPDTARRLAETDAAMKKLSGDWKGAWQDIAVATIGPATIIAKALDRIAVSAREATDALAHGGKSSLPVPFRAVLAAAMKGWQQQGSEAPAAAEPFGPVRSSQDDLANLFITEEEKRRRKERERMRREMLETARQHDFLPSFGPQRTEEDTNQRAMTQHLLGMFNADQKINKGLVPQADLKDQLAAAAREFEAFAQKVKESFDIIHGTIYDSFYSVLTNLTNRTQTFGSAMKSIWQGIVLSIEQAMANLVASAITSAFLKLLGFALAAIFPSAAPIILAGTSAASGLPTGLSPLTSGPGAATSALAPRPGAAGRGGNTYIIQSIAAKDVIGSLTSPTGAMRYANDRLFEVMAAS